MPVAQEIAIKALQDIQHNQLGLDDALKCADLAQVHYHAHSLKGVASLLKCHQLFTCAQEIEALAKTRQLQAVVKRVPQLVAKIQSSTQALADFVALNETQEK